MPRPAPRLLLLLPTLTYRAVAFVEAARRLGVEVTVGSERPSTFERANPVGLMTLDFADPARAAGQARAFARSQVLHGVVAVDDDTAVVAAAVAEELGLRGNPVAAAVAARDKHQQRRLFVAAGVAAPRFELLTTAADPERVARGASYPCVLKPLRLSASRGVIRADTPAEFVAAFERIKRILAQAGCEMRDAGGAGQHASHIPHPASRSLLVEEFVAGPEVAVEGLVTHGALTVLAIFDKPDPLEGPFFEETIYVTPSRLAPAAHQEVAACARSAGRTDPCRGPLQRPRGVADRARGAFDRRAVQWGAAIREPGCGRRDAGCVARGDHYSARPGHADPDTRARSAGIGRDDDSRPRGGGLAGCAGRR